MEGVLRARAAAQGGYLHRSDLLELGRSDAMIRHDVQTSVLRRIRVGTYVVRDTFDRLFPEAQHSVLARSVYDKFEPGTVALSHHSSALEQGLSVFGANLAVVDVVRLDDGAGRVESGVVHHEARLRADEIVEVGGRLMTSPARAVWETACASDSRGGLVVMDSALHQELITREALADVSGRFTAWQGARAARLSARLADAGAENAGESLYRFLCIEAGLPKPDTQLVILDETGLFVARTDLGWWERRHVAEMDGMRKYWRDLRVGEDASNVVVREKLREDRVRGLSWGMTRASYSEVLPDNAPMTAARLAHDLEQSHRLYARGRRYL